MFAVAKFASKALLVIALLFSATSVLTACPNCKDALESKDGKMYNVARGYYYSILLMLGTPPLIMAGFGLAVYRAYNRAAKEKAEEAAAQAGNAQIENDRV